MFIVPGFVNIKSWLADVRENADPHVTCILVGNKVDLCSDSDGTSNTATSPIVSGFRRAREVTSEEAERFAKEEGLLFVEASAKSGQNVEKAFEDSARDILSKVRRGVFDDNRVSTVMISLFRLFAYYFGLCPYHLVTSSYLASSCMFCPLMLCVRTDLVGSYVLCDLSSVEQTRNAALAIYALQADALLLTKGLKLTLGK